MYQGPNDLTWPRGTTADGPGRRPGAVRSRSAPRATVNAPEDSPWSWKPVRCPGSQLSSHTSWSSSEVSRWYQRRSRSYRTRLSHSCSLAATPWTICRSRAWLSGELAVRAIIPFNPIVFIEIGLRRTLPQITRFSRASEVGISHRITRPGRHGSAGAHVKLVGVALPQGTGGQRAPERLAARTVEIPDPGDLVALFPEPAGVAWIRHGDGLAGWGETARVTLPAGEDRFTAGEKWLRELFDGAEVDDQVAEPGTGPVAFGSFTFDSTSDGSVLVVPETIVGRRGGRSWLTTIRPLAASREEAPSWPAADRPGPSPAPLTPAPAPLTPAPAEI